MKKLLVLTIALILTLSLAACGEDGNPTATTPDTTSDTTSTTTSATTSTTTSATTSSSSAPNTSAPTDFAEITGNGLSFALPVDIKYVKTDDNSGSMIFVNEENTAVVTLGVKTVDAVTSAHITEDVLLAALSAGGGLSDATLESSGTVEQDGGTVVVGFGKGTMKNGVVMNSVIQYFFPADGGYHVISYLYAVDGGSSLDDNIEQVLSTVKTAK